MGTWSPLPKPYAKYVYEDPNSYNAVDPDLIKGALSGAGFGEDAANSIFTSWQNSMGTTPTTTTNTDGSSTSSPPLDYKTLIENDPVYKQARADMSAEGISDASSRAAALRRTLIDWGVIPDFAGAADKLSSTALGFLGTDVDQRTKDLAAQNEAQGLSLHSKLGRANDDNIRAIRNALAARGMYQSGELGYGLDENSRQYKQASTDAEKQVLGGIEESSGRFVQAERERQRQLAGVMSDAAGRALTQIGSQSSGTTNTSGTTSKNTAGTSKFLLPANTATVWDVNTASTYDAINAAKQSGGGIVIRPDDPESITKANGAAEAGVPVSIQVNGDANDTPATLSARITQYQQQYPGASFTLDLESPNFRGGPGSPGYAAMQQYAQQVASVAGTTPITITTEGVSDFNYGAWANNPNVTFAPQAYNGDMSPRNVQQVVDLLVGQGVDPSRIIPVVAPGQDLGGYTGPVSVYGAQAGAPAAAAPVKPPVTQPTDPYAGYQTPYISPVPHLGIDDVYHINKYLGME